MPLVHACLSVSEWSFVSAKEVTSMFSLCPIMICAYAIHGATVICKFFMQETYLGLGETARKYANAIWHQIYIKHSFLSIKQSYRDIRGIHMLIVPITMRSTKVNKRNVYKQLIISPRCSKHRLMYQTGNHLQVQICHFACESTLKTAKATENRLKDDPASFQESLFSGLNPLAVSSDGTWPDICFAPQWYEFHQLKWRVFSPDFSHCT